MKRYFEANVEDAVRIAVVEADDFDMVDGVPEMGHREISSHELPDNFAEWKRYTAHAYPPAIVEVMSEHGD